YLIVVCSPSAARSKWVNKEIETFRQVQPPDHVLAMVVDGEPNVGGERECFPPALREKEPLAGDVRPRADGRKNAKVKLIAGMLGVTFDALKNRDAHRRIRRLQYTVAVVGALLVAFALLALYANQQRRTALAQRRAATIAKGQAVQQRDQARRQAYFASVKG